MNLSTAKATIVLGEQLGPNQMKNGDTIVLRSAASDIAVSGTDYVWSDYYLAPEKPTAILTDECAWILEYDGTDATTERPTFYLRNLKTGKYFGKWTTKYEQIMSDTKDDDAIAFAFVSYTFKKAFGEKECQLRNDSTCELVFTPVSFTDRQVPGGLNMNVSTGVYNIMPKTLYQNCYINVYRAVEEQDPKTDLTNLLNEINNAKYNFLAGTDPGFYDAEAVSTYEQALSDATIVNMNSNPTAQECSEATENLRNALDSVLASQICITEGYYYLVSALPYFMNEQGLEKGLTINDNASDIMWDTFDNTNPDFIWQITGDGSEGYYVQNFGTNKYIGLPDFKQTSTFSSATSVGYTDEASQQIELRNLTSGQWAIIPILWNDSHTMLSSYGLSTPAEPTKETDHARADYVYENIDKQYCWYLRKITDSDFIENLQQLIDNKQRVAELNLLIAQSCELAATTEVLDSTGDGLITKAGGGYNSETSEGDQLLFSTIRRQGIAGSDMYQYLIDNDPATYMQGTGYIQIDLSQVPQSAVSISYNTRGGTEQQQTWGLQERPDAVTLYATNNLEDDNWTLIGSTQMGSLPLPATWSLNLANEYKYLRLNVSTNASGKTYFTLGELQVYQAVVNQELSQYYTVEGMSDKVDALRQAIDESRQKVESKTVTSDDIDALKAAMADVKALYVDTTSLVGYITEAQSLLDAAEIGSEIGQYPNAEPIDALKAAIDAAKDPALYQEPFNKTALDNACIALKAAINDFRMAINKPTVGTWYYIRNVAANDNRKGAAIRPYANDVTSYLVWSSANEDGTIAEAYNPNYLWQLVAIDSTANYALQNMGTGFYMGDFVGTAADIQMSLTPVAYTISQIEGKQFAIVPASSANNKGYGLTACAGSGNKVQPGQGPETNQASAWTFETIDPDMQGITVTSLQRNSINVVTLPFSASNLSEFNEDAHAYGIRKMSQEEADGELITSVELYEKTEIQAGEPFILLIGNLEEQSEATELVLSIPTNVVSEAIASNGLQGSLPYGLGVAGTALSNGKQFTALTHNTRFNPQGGVINTELYTGEVAGTETALTLTISGLNKLPVVARRGDVNLDGKVNATDVVSVYNYILGGEASGITRERANVNGDNLINSADVVAIYNCIINGTL